MIRSNINLFGHSAQQILCAEVETPAACGTACGSGDKEEKPAACGAGDKEEKPAACGTACGAGEK